MRAFLLEAGLLALVVLAIAALVFQSTRARNVLRTLRNAAFLYALLVLGLGAFELVRRTM